MKSLCIFISVMIMGINISAQKNETVKWYTIDEALKLNEKVPRNLLIDVYTDWCGWCKVMDKETFSNPIIAKYINENFYPIKFNAEGAEPVEFAGNKYINQGSGPRSTHQFAAALGVNSYPAIAYFTGKLEYLGLRPGFAKPEDIEPLLHYIVEEKYKDNIKFEDYQQTFVSSFPKK